MKKLLALFLMLGSTAAIATPVNVNTADAATIAAALQGIGLKKAQEIVAYREANGAFKTVADLENVKGIGAKTLAKNQADILLSGASAPVAAASAAVKTPAVKAPVATAPAAVIPKAAKEAAAVANPLK